MLLQCRAASVKWQSGGRALKDTSLLVCLSVVAEVCTVYCCCTVFGSSHSRRILSFNPLNVFMDFMHLYDNSVFKSSNTLHNKEILD